MPVDSARCWTSAISVQIPTRLDCWCRIFVRTELRSENCQNYSYANIYIYIYIHIYLSIYLYIYIYIFLSLSLSLYLYLGQYFCLRYLAFAQQWLRNNSRVTFALLARIFTIYLVSMLALDSIPQQYCQFRYSTVNFTTILSISLQHCQFCHNTINSVTIRSEISNLRWELFVQCVLHLEVCKGIQFVYSQTGKLHIIVVRSAQSITSNMRHHINSSRR